MDQHRLRLLEQRQFDLTTLFAATAFFAVQFAAIRLIGWTAIPVCVHLTATAAILVWTRDRTRTGARMGFTLASLLAALLLLRIGYAAYPDSLLVLLSLPTLGSWIGAALNGLVQGDSVCAAALLVGLIWGMTALAIM